MIKSYNDAEEADEEYLDYEERNKFLWSLRSDFAWAGKKIPESVEVDGREYRLRDMVRELSEKESLDTDKAAEIRALIPKLNEKSKADEELLETEELTKSEAEALYEEATGLLRASMELKDKLEGKAGKKVQTNLKGCSKLRNLWTKSAFRSLLKV